MKRSNSKTLIVAISIGVLFLILGTVNLAFAQKDQHDQDARPQKQEQQARPEQQQHHPETTRQDQQSKGVQQPAKSLKKRQNTKSQQPNQQTADQQEQQKEKGLQKQGTSKPVQQNAKGMQKQQTNSAPQQVQRVQQGEQRGVWQQHRAQSWQSEHRTWGQRGGYNGYRIPDDHFDGYFCRDHGFRIYSLSLEIFGGYPRFQYEGYWFSVVDPWPEYWPNNWYENDDVYIDYIGDGYYLYNRRYPRDRIAVIVYMS